MSRADDIVVSACDWIVRNRDGWGRLQEACRRLHREEFPIQRDTVYSLAMQFGIAIYGDPEYRRDHNLWAVLARFIVMECPEMFGSFVFRRSIVDTVDLVATYEGVVGPAPFVAGSLAEAKAIWKARHR